MSNNSNPLFNKLTNRFALSKTLRFELKPEPITARNLYFGIDINTKEGMSQVVQKILRQDKDQNQITEPQTLLQPNPSQNHPFEKDNTGFPANFNL
jgi:glucose/arabinose dehydrogenase